jgi:ATP-dependent helicase/nuclease subunit B
MSGSMLEMAGRCPMAYFLKYVIGIRPPDNYEIDQDRWLDHLQFGNLLHEVFYAFVSEIGQDHWPPLKMDILRLKEILNEIASRYKDLYPPPSEDAFLDQLRELNSAAEIFLREEERLEGRTPAFLEVSIGLSPYEKGSALDSKEPVRVRLSGGGSVRFRGRLDRIDRVGTSNNYVIVDYKTGSALKYENSDPFRGGRVIQHALYIAIARKILKEKFGADAEVEGFEYFFPGGRSHGLRLTYDQSNLYEFDAILNALCNLIAEGSLLPTDDQKSDCYNCDYRLVCGDAELVAAASAIKLDNPSNTQLQYMKELRNRD